MLACLVGLSCPKAVLCLTTYTEFSLYLQGFFIGFAPQTVVVFQYPYIFCSLCLILALFFPPATPGMQLSGCPLALVQDIVYFFCSWAPRPAEVQSFKQASPSTAFICLSYTWTAFIFPLWNNVFERSDQMLLQVVASSFWSWNSSSKYFLSKIYWQLNAIRSAHSSPFNLTQMGCPNGAKNISMNAFLWLKDFNSFLLGLSRVLTCLFLHLLLWGCVVTRVFPVAFCALGVWLHVWTSSSRKVFPIVS